ncbi:MAG: hypothetical protein M3Z03_01445, partial [Actinomycetota bacterium]|nr:hypothetical protein [Actinomycetota bacterium]
MRRPDGRGLGGLLATAIVMVLLAVIIPIGPVGTSAAQEAPPTMLVPSLPDELDAVTSAVSPLVWQACKSVGLAVGLIVVAGTLLGVPPDVTVPLNEAVATTGGPVLALFFEVCQQIPLPDDPPVCAVDDQVPPLPSLGRPILLAGLLANELRALDATLTGLGAPLDGALGTAADDLLGCAEGRDAPEEPAPDDGAPAPDQNDPSPTGEGLFPAGPPPAGGSLVAPALTAGGGAAPDRPVVEGAPLPATALSSGRSTDGAGLA